MGVVVDILEAVNSEDRYRLCALHMSTCFALTGNHVRPSGLLETLLLNHMNRMHA
jgi:hypothetical protein